MNKQWWQCDILWKNLKREFWCRFIASSEDEAKEKVRNMLKKSLKGHPFLRIAAYVGIRDFDIFRVPQCILDRYDLNKSGEVDMLYDRARG